uniref:Vg2 n=1 Tax=Tetrastichus brontispae TaxID=2033808 RepID=A0A650FKR4_9HYME|nr:Vg2 [Tetrastichus brontispae]
MHLRLKYKTRLYRCLCVARALPLPVRSRRANASSRRERDTERRRAMAKLSRLVAVATACLVITNIVPTSTLKAGYEDLHIYDYKADISVGVEEPANYISKYSLHGVIKIQREVDQVSVPQYKYVIELTDLKHDSYFGEDAIRISKFEPVDKELIARSTFKSHYAKSGKHLLLICDKYEAKWLQKVKRSIALLLQFDWSVAKEGAEKEGKVHVTSVKEDTLHGKCFLNYNTTLVKNVSKTQKKVNLMKTVYPTKCDNFGRDIYGYGIDDKASRDAMKKRLDHKRTKIETVYELDVIENQPIIKKVFNYESYRVDFDSDDFDPSRNPQFVKVRQTLFLKKTEPGHELLHKKEKDVSPPKEMIINQEQVMNKVKELLLEVNQYMKENHIKEIKPGTEHDQLLNKIHYYLRDLDAKNYENLYNEIKEMKISEAETLRKIFIQITLYVGTESSLSFIKNMVMAKKVSDNEAINLISGMHIKRANEVLPHLEVFLKQDNGLSPEVQRVAVMTFSHLVSHVCRNNLELKDALIEKYIRSIDEFMKGAKTIDTKLDYLSVLGNTRCRGAIKYIKSVLPRQKNDSKDQIRLRMFAIFILSRLIDEDDSSVLEDLRKILYDKNETKEIRIAAYKVLVYNSDFDSEDLMEIGLLMSKNEHLLNYHVTTMRILNEIGIVKDYIEPKDATLSPLIVMNDAMELEEDVFKLVNLEFLTQLFDLDFTRKTFVRVAYVREFELSLSFASIATLVEYEVFQLVDGKIVLGNAGYIYGNVADYKGENAKEVDTVFADFANGNDNVFALQPINVSRIVEGIKNRDNLAKLVMDLFGTKLEKSWFAYANLKTFSIPTGFGMDAIYDYKQPTLMNLAASCDWTLTDQAKAHFKISLDFWTHSYSDIFVENPFTRLKHSVRKAHAHDYKIAPELIVKYGFDMQKFELALPLLTKDNRPKILRGASDYVSSSVMVTDRDGEMSCPTCGYQYTTKSGTEKLKKKYINSTLKPIGLSLNKVLYDCDAPEKVINEKSSNDAAASTCGKIQTTESDGSMSQAELKVEWDYEILLSTSTPWYFLPGINLNVELVQGVRKTFDGGSAAMAKFDLILTSSQGHFLNEGRFRHSLRLSENEVFNMCVDGKSRYPKVIDTSVLSTKTDSKFDMDVKIVFGESMSESCVGLNRGIEMRYVGEIPEEHVAELNKRSRNSKCAKQMQNSTFVYPPGSYLMTKHCIYELISNATFRRFRIDVKHEEIPTKSILTLVTLIETLKEKFKELGFKKFNLDVEVKSLSQLSDVLTNKTISFQVDSPVHAINKILPNNFFPMELVNEFINGDMSVINVYPKLVLFNNKEKKDLTTSLKDWTLIASDDGSVYKIYVKLLDDDKLRVKYVWDNKHLTLEPLEKKGESDSNFVPGIFYNSNVKDFSERSFIKSSEDILFR